jgi:nickel/cobalt exporter
MTEIITGTLLLSLLHALLPNHWLPVLAIGRAQGWPLQRVTRTMLLAGLAHALSTALLGVGLAVLGWKLTQSFEETIHWAAPAVLIAVGLVFMWRHHRHHHSHMAQPPVNATPARVLWALVLAMFLSPCLEVEAYFLLAGVQGWRAVLAVAGIYTLVSVTGMVSWVRVVYYGTSRFDWHVLEHNAGLVTGATLIATGILSFFLH